MIEAEPGEGLEVITEARETGTAGIYRGDGEVRMGLIDEIVHAIDPNRLIFEAPLKAQQVWFIRKFGPNVNLGNIPPDEVIPLETLRLDLRADTLLDATTGNVDGAGIDSRRRDARAHRPARGALVERFDDSLDEGAGGPGSPSPPASRPISTSSPRAPSRRSTASRAARPTRPWSRTCACRAGSRGPCR